MPELPEVESVARHLDARLAGKKIVQAQCFRSNLRTPFPPDFVKNLQGNVIRNVGRRGKYLLIFLENEQVWLSHLGMSGRWEVRHENSGKPGKQAREKHEHVRLNFDDGDSAHYIDPRRFGMMDIAEKSSLGKHAWLAQMGAEPLEKAFTPAYLRDRLKARRGPVKPALMDQSVIAGMGNIYASEALFGAKLHPQRGCDEAAKSAPALVRSVQKVLRAAIASGGSSLRDFLHIDGHAGAFQHHFLVYGRAGKPCVQCHTPIEQLTQAGRSTFFCPSCQK